MPNKPTARRRKPVDAFVWDIFVEACGSRCCSCGAEGVPLERGHIIQHSLDSSDSFDNLIPVCRPCNNRYKKKETPADYRPDDYLDRFFVALGQRLRPQISCITENGSRYLIPSSEQAENKQAISWRAAQNALPDPLLTRSSATFTRREADAELELLIAASQKLQPRPNRPFAATKTELVNKAMKHGRRFHIAGTGFLADQPWRIAGDADKVTHGDQAWRLLVDNFEQFVALGEDVLKKRQLQRAKDREKRQQEALDEKGRRWQQFLRVTECSGFTDDDHALISAARAEFRDPERDVKDDELQRAQGIWSREFYMRRKILNAMLAVCNECLHDEGGGLNDYYKDCVSKAESIADLRQLHTEITEYFVRVQKCASLSATTPRQREEQFMDAGKAWW